MEIAEIWSFATEGKWSTEETGTVPVAAVDGLWNTGMRAPVVAPPRDAWTELQGLEHYEVSALPPRRRADARPRRAAPAPRNRARASSPRRRPRTRSPRRHRSASARRPTSRAGPDPDPSSGDPDAIGGAT